MKEFLFAAMPWIIMGIALAILAVNYGVKKRCAHIAAGAGFGLLLGVTLNSCGLWENHILGIVLGLLCGMALGALYQDKEETKDDA